MTKDIIIKSKRNTNIHMKLELTNPLNGLVILNHSFKENLSEDGRFDRVCKILSNYQLNSLRIDFPGTSDDFLNYSLTNSINDLETAYQYVLTNYQFNHNHLALLGYSMGGRIMSLFYDLHPEFNKLVFWASCNQPFTTDDLFLQQNISILKEQCDLKGYCDYYNIFSNQKEKLSKDFIDDLINLDALKPLNKFNGNAIIIHGDNDETVNINNSYMIYDDLKNAHKKELFIIKGADHGFGLWSNSYHPKYDQELIDKTIDFLIQQ